MFLRWSDCTSQSPIKFNYHIYSLSITFLTLEPFSLLQDQQQGARLLISYLNSGALDLGIM